jgi:hypothetical protein
LPTDQAATAAIFAGSAFAKVGFDMTIRHTLVLVAILTMPAMLAACGTNMEQRAATGAATGLIIAGPVGAAVGAAVGAVVDTVEEKN